MLRTGTYCFARVVLAGCLALCMQLTVRADTIFESATLGPTGQPGGWVIGGHYSIAVQWPGVRFHVSAPTVVTAIGGHLSTQAAAGHVGIFGAILRLASASSLPAGSVSDPIPSSILVAHTTFTAFSLSEDVRVPLSAWLSPGSYALVFGSGYFGVEGEGLMPENNHGLVVNDYLSFLGPFGWKGFSFRVDHSPRFVVEGYVVPEPATAVLLVCVILFLACVRRWSPT